MVRVFGQVFVPIAVAVIGVGVLLALVSNGAATDARIAQDEATTRVAAESILDAIAPVRQHLRAVSREPALKAALDDPSPPRLDDLATTFSTLISRNLDYEKVRWIDQTGRERVRLNAGHPEPTRVAQDRLQEMAAQYFVSDALALPTGALYQSAFDLNIEYGIIEQPPRPTFRIAIKLADSRGAPAGLLMINVDGSALVRRLSTGDGPGRSNRGAGLQLVDSRGAWLHGPPGSDSFAFMYGRSTSLATLHPALWAQVLATPNGGADAGNGIWTWSAVDPTPELGSAQRANRTPWYVVYHDVGGDLGATRSRIVAGYGAMTTLMLALTALLSWRLARERKELLDAKAASETAARAKSEFLANMSHEIRTPMNAILGHARLLRREPCSPDQAPRIARINEAADHLLMLLNDILDMSKLDSGGMRLEKVDFSLSALLDGVSSLILPAARAKGLTVSIDPGNVPDRLEGDPTRLRQALVNYAGNALKFTHAGGIAIRCRTTDPASDAGFLTIRFEVQDSGVGIAPEAIPRLFKMFEQAEQSTTRQFGGTGLGLAITKRLAEMMGGDAGVESELGRGSTFWFTARLLAGRAPLALGAAHDSVEQRLRSAHAGSRVLLAEDNRVNRELATEVLERVGLHVTTAEDGEQAVREASRATFDIVLLDMQMPKIDGLEVCRQLRRTAVYQSAPILALTANAFEADRQACIDAGMNDFIGKPVDTETLYSQLLRWLPARAAPGTARVASATTSSFLSSPLPSIPGLDMEEARRILGPDEVLFRKLAISFVESKRSMPSDLRAAADAGDLATAGKLAHRLFGAASAIGATDIASRASEIDRAVRLQQSGPELLVGVRTVADDTARLIDAIAESIRLDATLPTAAPSPE